MLRDTAASQSLILEGVLLLSNESSIHLDVLVRGFGMQYEAIYLDTTLVKGKVMVGVRKEFPIEGVSILSNDLAERKVLVTPEVTAVPLPKQSDELETKHPGVFSVCVMTRARSRRESAADEGGEQLCDSFMADLYREKNVTKM